MRAFSELFGSVKIIIIPNANPIDKLDAHNPQIKSNASHSKIIAKITVNTNEIKLRMFCLVFLDSLKKLLTGINDIIFFVSEIFGEC